MEVISQLLLKYPMAGLVLAAVGAVMVFAQMVAFLTPSKKDDEFLAKIQGDSFFGKIWSFFISFAPLQKGAKGLELSNTNLEKK